MKESDLCVIAVVYGVATWFLVMTLQLPPAAQSYPLILLTALYLCNTLFLGKQLYSFYRHRVVLNDFRKLFAGFLPGQFFGVLAGCIIYMAAVSSICRLFLMITSNTAILPTLPGTESIQIRSGQPWSRGHFWKNVDLTTITDREKNKN